MAIRIASAWIGRIGAPLAILIALQMLFVVLKWVFPSSSWIYTPLEILGEFPGEISGDLGSAIVATIGRTVGGFAIASCAGVAFGILLGRNHMLHTVVRPIIDFLRPLPSSALAPIAVMVIGFGEVSYQLIIVYGAIWPILLSTYDGTARIHATSSGVMRQLGLGRWAHLKWFILPEAAKEILTGMKISISICLILAVTAELIIGQRTGLGAYIKDTSGSGNLAQSYLGVITVAMVGLLLNGVFRLFESRTPWLINRDEIPVE